MTTSDRELEGLVYTAFVAVSYEVIKKATKSELVKIKRKMRTVASNDIKKRMRADGVRYGLCDHLVIGPAFVRDQHGGQKFVLMMRSVTGEMRLRPTPNDFAQAEAEVTSVVYKKMP